MHLYIPEIGDSIKLTNDWKFTVHNEKRNSPLLYEHFNITGNPSFYGTKKSLSDFEMILHTGDVLIVDRIYVKKGASDYSSITFRLKEQNGKKCSKRFWVKLHDANNIEFEKHQKARNISWKHVYNHSANNANPHIVNSILYKTHVKTNIKPGLKIGDTFSQPIFRQGNSGLVKDTIYTNINCHKCTFGGEKFSIIGEYVIQYLSTETKSRYEEANFKFISKSWTLYNENDQVIETGSSFNTLKKKVKTGAELRADKVKKLTKKLTEKITAT